MSDETTNSPGNRGRTALEGRSACAVELRRHLMSASPAYLEGAMHNPAITRNEMVLLLRNRAVSADVLARVARDHRWTRHHEIRRRIVRHPRAPLPMTRGLVTELFWRDLADVVEDTRLHPALRREAEQVLRDRLGELSTGERIALARRAGRGLIEALRAPGETPVLRALLANARLREEDAQRIAAGQEVRGEVLRALANHPAWGRSRAVLLALARNPRTPVAAALKVLSKLPAGDVSRLADDETVPRIIRVGAARISESGEDQAP